MSKLDIQSTQLKRKYSNIRNQLPDIGHRNGVFVFPYELRSGYLNKTEDGYIWDDYEVDSYGFFQKLITGKDSINVVWENSTQLIKPKGVNRYYYDFKVGTYYLGEIVGNNLNAETQFYDDDLGRKNIKIDNTITLHFVYNEENDYEKYFPDLKPFMVEKEDMFKIYKIPQLFGDEWMYISNVNYETIPNDNEIVGCFITFVSLNEQLLKSGQAIESYIHENAPNEPYAKPSFEYIKNEKNEIIPSIVLDEIAKSFDRRMVKHLQLEIYGTSALSAITIIGRRLKKDENGKTYFTSWQFLYPYSFVKPKIYNLEKTSSPSSNFYIFPKCTLDFTTSIDWIEQWKKASDVVATNSFTGVLNIGNGNEWENGVHKSNPINNSEIVVNGLHFDYWNNGWFPFSNIDCSQQYSLTKDNPYCVNNLWFDQTDTFLKILIKNSFIYFQQLELPLGWSNTKPYKWSDVPIIGGLVVACMGDRTLISNFARKKTIPICCFIDTSAATCAANILLDNEDRNKKIPLSFFGGEDVPKYLGADVCNTTLCFNLTHLFVDQNNKEWDTIYLGETTNENFVPLFAEEPKKEFQYDGSLITKDTEETYIIDKVIVQGLMKGKIKLTFFDENEELANPIWTTTVQSSALFTNSLRNWTTEITTGCWNDKYTLFEDAFTWPTFPPHGIITNQSPIYSPTISFRNITGNCTINGKYPISTTRFSLFTKEIEIRYEEIDPTLERIHNEQTLKENVEEMILNIQYTFSLRSENNKFERVVKNKTISIVIPKEKLFDYFYQTIFYYSDVKDKVYGDYIQFYGKDDKWSNIVSDEFTAWDEERSFTLYSLAGTKSTYTPTDDWKKCSVENRIFLDDFEYSSDKFNFKIGNVLEFYLKYIPPIELKFICLYYSFGLGSQNNINGGKLYVYTKLENIIFKIKEEE